MARISGSKPDDGGSIPSTLVNIRTCTIYVKNNAVTLIINKVACKISSI